MELVIGTVKVVSRRLAFHCCHARGGRAAPRPGENRLDRIGLSLQDRLYAAVATVAYPAPDAAPDRFGPYRVAKSDALDAARDAQVKRYANRAILHHDDRERIRGP